MELRALRFATVSHQGQFRRGQDRKPYITHPIGVKNLLKEAGVTNKSVLAAALLHDTVEDCEGVSPNDVYRIFGEEICEMVMQLTDEQEMSRSERHRLQAEHIAWMNENSILVKMADRIYNLGDFTKEAKETNKDKLVSYLEFAKNLQSAIFDRSLAGEIQNVKAWNTLYGQLSRAIEELEAVTVTLS